MQQGAPKSNGMLLNMLGCSWLLWGAPSYDGVLPSAMGCSWLCQMLPAVTECCQPRRGAPGPEGGVASCDGVLPAPRGALTPAAPGGEQQARRRELFTAASCSRKLSTSLCAASARCKRAESASGWAPLVRPTGLQDLHRPARLLSILLPPPSP